MAVSSHYTSNSLLYPLKRFSEKIRIELSLNSESKAKLQSEFIQRRAEELVYLVENNKTGFFEEARSRYVSSVQEYNTLHGDTVYLREEKGKLLIMLSGLRDRYPSNSAYWLILQQTVDATNSI